MIQKNLNKDFLGTYDPDKFEKLSVATDLLIFSVSDAPTDNYRKLSDKSFSVLLIKRDEPPFNNTWALPGGFVNINESLESAAERTLKRETNQQNLYMEQLYTFGNVTRDPRMRIISTAYMALVDKNNLQHKISDNAAWFNISLSNGTKTTITLTRADETREKFGFAIPKTNDTQLNEWPEIKSPDLAFDHALILTAGILRLKNKIEYTDLVFHMMPTEFTLTELQKVYEAILGKKLLAPAFRRIIADKVEKTGNMTSGGGHRPSALFKLKK